MNKKRPLLDEWRALFVWMHELICVLFVSATAFNIEVVTFILFSTHPMLSTNTSICPKCQETNSPLATACVICGAPLAVHQAPPTLSHVPVAHLPKGEVEALTEGSPKRRVAASIMQGFGIFLCGVGILGGLYGLFFPREIVPGHFSYGVARACVAIFFGGLGVWRFGASGFDWGELGVDLEAKTQWGPVIMAPGVLGLPIGALMWFGMREHSFWVGCLMLLSLVSLLVGGFVYAREVIAANR